MIIPDWMKLSSIISGQFVVATTKTGCSDVILSSSSNNWDINYEDISFFKLI